MTRQDYVTVGVHMPTELRDRIKRSAKEDGRSMSSFVRRILERHLMPSTQDKSAMCPFDCGTVLIAHPDPLMVHTFYCPTCEKSVVFAPEVTG